MRIIGLGMSGNHVVRWCYKDQEYSIPIRHLLLMVGRIFGENSISAGGDGNAHGPHYGKSSTVKAASAAMAQQQYQCNQGRSAIAKSMHSFYTTTI